MIWAIAGSLAFVIISQIPVFIHLRRREKRFYPLLVRAVPETDVALEDALKHGADGKTM